MYKMTSHERFKRMFEHREADRVAMWDFPWPGTLKRWHQEGMPENISYEDYFDVDKVGRIEVDNSPRYPEYVVKETNEFITKMTKWGCQERNFKNDDSTPDLISYTITSPDVWLKAKKNMIQVSDRIPWDYLKKNYGKWCAEGCWIIADSNFGFNHFLSLVVGTEQFLIALLEDPDWCFDMMNYSLDLDLALLDLVWDAGYVFDMFNIRDDLGYSHSQYFSVNTYKELIKPVHAKAVKWAHEKGVKVRLHSCGCIEPLIPEIIDAKFDALHPLQIKAGMKPTEVKSIYGDKIVIHGGFDSIIWKDIDAIRAEIQRLLPVLMRSGGYIFAADHSIPNNVSFENIKEIISLAKKLGTY